MKSELCCWRDIFSELPLSVKFWTLIGLLYLLWILVVICMAFYFGGFLTGLFAIAMLAGIYLLGLSLVKGFKLLYKRSPQCIKNAIDWINKWVI
jgi:hypothetical protein